MGTTSSSRAVKLEIVVTTHRVAALSAELVRTDRPPPWFATGAELHSAKRASTHTVSRGITIDELLRTILEDITSTDAPEVLEQQQRRAEEDDRYMLARRIVPQHLPVWPDVVGRAQAKASRTKDLERWASHGSSVGGEAPMLAWLAARCGTRARDHADVDTNRIASTLRGGARAVLADRGHLLPVDAAGPFIYMHRNKAAAARGRQRCNKAAAERQRCISISPYARNAMKKLRSYSIEEGDTIEIRDLPYAWDLVAPISPSARNAMKMLRSYSIEEVDSDQQRTFISSVWSAQYEAPHHEPLMRPSFAGHIVRTIRAVRAAEREASVCGAAGAHGGNAHRLEVSAEACDSRTAEWRAALRESGAAAVGRCVDVVYPRVVARAGAGAGAGAAAAAAAPATLDGPATIVRTRDEGARFDAIALSGAPLHGVSLAALRPLLALDDVVAYAPLAASGGAEADAVRAVVVSVELAITQ